MPFFDILKLALRNLSEAKLRAVLTTIGVVVGVAVIVTMVSFGLGLQRNTVERFRSLDLFNEIIVNGRNLNSLVETAMSGGRRGGQANNGGANNNPNGGDANGNGGNPARGLFSSSSRTLDDAALAEIAKMSGVASVEPNVSFGAYIRANNRVARRNVGGTIVPNESSKFKTFAVGRMISSPDADECVVDEEFTRAFGFEKAQDAIGQTLELLAPRSPQTFERRAQTENGKEKRAKSHDESDSMSFFGLPLESNDASTEANGSKSEKSSDDASNNSSNDNASIAKSFCIVGVLQSQSNGGGFRGFTLNANVYIPLKAANDAKKLYRNPLDDVALRLARAQGAIGENESEGYSSAIVRVSSPAILSDVRKELTDAKFSTFAFVDQLEQIKTFFLVINAALGLLGGISLLVASFGIANTMIMSILERTREIGIMKAIGADDREIRLIFFVEAACIGLAGGVIGVLAGWAIDATANRLAYRFLLKPRGASFIDFFALPPSLWLGAILFAVTVAIVAALYPASRAARIDPVKALRHD